MTQFKFGDKVRHPNFDSTCVFVCQLYDAETKEKTWAIVLNESEYDKGTQFVTHEPLTPIPHPDTVRLDFLADRNQHIANVQLPTECVVCNMHSMRAAIDHAMELYHAEK